MLMLPTTVTRATIGLLRCSARDDGHVQRDMFSEARTPYIVTR
jgi:hypothetical protein